MTRTRCTLAILASILVATEAPAQFLPPVVGLPTIGQGGIAFRVGGKNLRIAGFVPLGDPYPAILPVTPTPFGYRPVGPAFLPYGYYGYPYPPVAPGFPLPGYGAIDQRITVTVINPPVVVRRPRVGLRDDVDLSGIDLDVESPEKIWGKRPELAKNPPPKKNEVAKAEPPPAKKQQVAAAPAPPPPAPKPPNLVPEGERLVQLGIASFREGEYGLALLRFRNAALADPPGPRALFLQGQALVAIGRYREAMEAIHFGLESNRDWPASEFRPRAELYDNKADVWHEHRGAVEKALKANPKNADYPFLLGYLDWFDGERESAIAYFQQARVLAADVRWSDVFLKIGKK